jgi:hypothetical protein
MTTPLIPMTISRQLQSEILTQHMVRCIGGTWFGCRAKTGGEVDGIWGCSQCQYC